MIPQPPRSTRIDTLRPYTPLVRSLAYQGQVPLGVEFRGGKHVAEIAVASGSQAAPVAPLVRITDLGSEPRPLLQCLRPGFRAHPGEVLDPCFQRGAEVPHQLLHARLGLGRERDLDIALPQRLAGLVLDGAEHALPARLLFLLSAHLPAVEIEMLDRKSTRLNSSH